VKAESAAAEAQQRFDEAIASGRRNGQHQIVAAALETLADRRAR
jgi:hypothetical protein